MTTDVLRSKVEDVINTLSVALREAEDVERARIALENSSIVASQRDKKQNEREVALTQKAEDLNRQQTYIDEQNTNVQLVLTKIQLEKKGLSNLADEKRLIEKERLQLEVDKKGLEGLLSEKRIFEEQKIAFEKEKDLLMQAKKTFNEAQRLFAIKEENIKRQASKLDTIERMTSV